MLVVALLADVLEVAVPHVAGAEPELRQQSGLFYRLHRVNSFSSSHSILSHSRPQWATPSGWPSLPLFLLSMEVLPNRFSSLVGLLLPRLRAERPLAASARGWVR